MQVPSVHSTAAKGQLSPPPPITGGAEDASFDRWLRRELTRLYDPVLHEPVPEALRRLLEEKPPREGSN
jgi:hypothetical protein